MCIFGVNRSSRVSSGHHQLSTKPLVSRRILASCNSFLLLTILVFAGCASNSIQTPAMNPPPKTQPSPSIVANPNPVPAGPGFGITKITWNTGDESWGQVYLSDNGQPERMFIQGPEGSADAPWIGRGTYEFRLYQGSEHKKLLATVKVTRDEKTSGATSTNTDDR
jgi:hypothetical protein